MYFKKAKKLVFYKIFMNVYINDINFIKFIVVLFGDKSERNHCFPNQNSVFKYY